MQKHCPARFFTERSSCYSFQNLFGSSHVVYSNNIFHILLPDLQFLLGTSREPIHNCSHFALCITKPGVKLPDSNKTTSTATFGYTTSHKRCSYQLLHSFLKPINLIHQTQDSLPLPLHHDDSLPQYYNECG